MDIAQFTPVIANPSVEHAASFAHLRKTVYTEELHRIPEVRRTTIETWISGWDSQESIEKIKQNIVEWNVDPTVFSKVLLLGGSVAGICLGHGPQPGKPYNYLDILQLQPEIRRQGWGATLMRQFLRHTDQNLPTRLHVLQGNTPAIAFYHTQGFKFTESNRTFKIGNYEIITHAMERNPTL